MLIFSSSYKPLHKLNTHQTFKASAEAKSSGLTQSKNSSMDANYFKQALMVKEAKHVYKKLICGNPMECLQMTDFIQRLGIEHHFEEEIEAALRKQHLMLSSHLSNFVNSHQLDELALTFRLLRQGGHYVSADLFESLTCDKRKFKGKYGDDVKGLIALYEASQLSVQGEVNLDKAGYLSCELLDAWQSRHQDNGEATSVSDTLQYPLHYGLSQFMDSRALLRDFKTKNEWTCLEELAKINSCIITFMHQNEIIEVSKWWKDLRLAKEEKFAGYQPLTWYKWPMACYTDPHFSNQRIEITKPISLIYILDDIFYVYGTLDQLTLFTDAVNRWELAGTEQLPDYMKSCLNALYDITNDFAETIYEKHGLNPIGTLKKSWVRLLNACLTDAHWLRSSDLPKAEEYLNNGIVSSGMHVMLVHAFFLLDHGITKETVTIMEDNFPNIIYSVAKILRLSDDLEGAKSPHQTGLDGSYLDCYMNEHKHISAEEVQRHVVHLISDEWKSLNREILTSNPFPSSFTKFCLNAARMVPLLYYYRSNPSLSNLQKYVKSLVNVGAGNV